MKADRFFDKGWRLNSIQEVFGLRCKELLQSIPESERWNLYYTAAHCFEDAKREMREMRIIPFDIDGIAYDENYKKTCMDIAEVVASCVGTDVANLGVLFSGNGVQVIVNIDTPITSKDYFDIYRKHYGVICSKIEAGLKTKNIKGDIDPTVFDDARILRLPWTENRKKDKPTRMAEVIYGDIKPIPWDIIKISGVEEATVEVLTDAVLKTYPTPDAEAVLQECGFLQHCKVSPAIIKEYEWYAMISVTSRLPGGDEITHKLSEGHPQYNSFETDAKIRQALASSGPRTCKNIATMFDGCKNCPHWGKITSPIQIKGQDYIASKDFGFRERSIAKNGQVVTGKPAYDDIIKMFMMDYNYRVMDDSGEVYVYNGKFWGHMRPIKVKEWIAAIIKPSPSSTEVEETLARIRFKNVVNRKEFMGTAKGFLNFTNCVYDINNDKTLAHGPEFGFFNVIPYAYDKDATCPLWDRFMIQIMQGKQELIDALMQFAGYSLAYDSYWIQKCLLLYGSGSNGKSVYAETIAKVLGEDNVTTLSLRDIINDKQTRMGLANKLMNYSDEAPRDVFKDTAIFKTLTQGGSMNVKQLYVQEYSVENRAKFVISCNELPFTLDATDGFFRRFLIIPFDFKIEPGDEGYIPDLKERMWATELPGICNRLIEAYKKLCETKILKVPEESTKLLTLYRNSSDVVKMFIDDCVVHTGNELDVVTNAFIYEQYVTYANVNGYSNKLSSAQFGIKFGKLTKSDSTVQWVNGKSIRVRVGYKINKEW